MEITSNNKTIMKKINKIRRLTFPDFKAYSKATVTKIMCSMQKYIQTDQRLWEESRNKHTHTSQVILRKEKKKGVKAIQ